MPKLCSEAACEGIRNKFQKPYAFILQYRKSGIYEGKNRPMGIMRIVNNGFIESSGLINESVFPARTLY